MTARWMSLAAQPAGSPGVTLPLPAVPMAPAGLKVSFGCTPADVAARKPICTLFSAYRSTVVAPAAITCPAANVSDDHVHVQLLARAPGQDAAAPLGV